MQKPVVIVLCITYNHEKFIAQALHGFVTQKTNFPFQVLVADDASTDHTPEIIAEYARKHPDIINPILHRTRRGVWENFVSTAERISSPYVAMCEGDDYWTDENKLQKQVDFLEQHHDCVLCFHPVEMMWEDQRMPKQIFPSDRSGNQLNMYTLSDLLESNFIQTNSVVYRWRFGGNEQIRSIFPKDILPCDYFLHLLHAEKGGIHMLDEVMSVYRRHTNGIWTGAGVSDEWFIKCGLQHLNFWSALEKRFHRSYAQKKAEFGTKIILAGLRLQRFDVLKEMANYDVDLYEKSILALAHPSEHGFRKLLKQNRRYRRLVFVLGMLFLLAIMLLWAGWTK